MELPNNDSLDFDNLVPSTPLPVTDLIDLMTKRSQGSTLALATENDESYNEEAATTENNEGEAVTGDSGKALIKFRFFDMAQLCHHSREDSSDTTLRLGEP